MTTVADLREALRAMERARRSTDELKRRAFPEDHGFTKGDADELRELACLVSEQRPADRRTQAKLRRMSENLRKVAAIVARIED